MDAVSGREDETHRADKRVGKTKKKREQTFIETMNIMAKQREGPSGQHFADSATLASAAVKVARAQWNGQHAIVVTIEKLLTRGKTAKVMIVSSRSCENVVTVVPHLHL